MVQVYENMSKQNNRTQMYLTTKIRISKLVIKNIQEINEFCSQGSKITNEERFKEM